MGGGGGGGSKRWRRRWRSRFMQSLGSGQGGEVVRPPMGDRSVMGLFIYPFIYSAPPPRHHSRFFGCRFQTGSSPFSEIKNSPKPQMQFSCLKGNTEDGHNDSNTREMWHIPPMRSRIGVAVVNLCYPTAVSTCVQASTWKVYVSAPTFPRRDTRFQVRWRILYVQWSRAETSTDC